MDRLEKLRLASQDWNDEYLAEQYDLGPTAYATEAAWEIIENEYQNRELEVYQPIETVELQIGNGVEEDEEESERPRNHTWYAANRLVEGTPYVDVISGLIERGLVAGEAHQLVRELAEARRDEASKSARLGLLWCAGGVSITAATFFTAEPGETFIIAWGAIAYGAIQALQSWNVSMMPLPKPDENLQQRPHMSVIDQLWFDATGFTAADGSETWKVWKNDEGVVVATEFHEGAPDPGPVDAPQALRDGLREACLNDNAGVVDISFAVVGELPVLRTIVKRVIDEETGWGRSYHGVMQILFRDCLFAIGVDAQEQGTTGVRESMVLPRMMAERVVTIGEGGRRPVTDNSTIAGPASLEGWLSDPHDPTPPHLARNRSEDTEFDHEFAWHPLSQVRSVLDQMQASLEIAKEFRQRHPVWVGDPAARRGERN